MKHFISSFDFDVAEIKTIFNLTSRLKDNPSAYHSLFRGKSLGLIFEKPSTRTWVSFQIGFASMGGHVIYLGPDDIELGVRETVADAARVLSGYLDAVVMRTYSHREITTFAKYFQKPVINGLSNHEHPCQALGDLFTIQELLGSPSGKKIAYVGDGNNVLNSLLITAAKLGTNLSFATPKGCEPPSAILAKVKKLAAETGAKIAGFHEPRRAVTGADIVYTDVWVSMGEEESDEKEKIFKGFQVNRALLKHATKAARFMHCLPAKRGKEVTDDVIDGRRSVVFEQSRNRLHVQKAILIYLLGMTKASGG